jgi:hypothetical protein
MAPALHRTAADFLLPDPATSKRRCGAADHVLPHTGPVTYGMADVAFTMKQRVQTDRQARALAVFGRKMLAIAS